MNRSNRLDRRSACLALAGLAFAAPGLAQADHWPARPIRVIVPTPPGGAYDATMRPLAQELAQILKQPVVVENRPGAGNILGTQVGAAAAPDGYTLTMTGMVNTIAAGVYDNLPFDIVKDFSHIGSIGAAAQWLVVRSDAGFGSMRELIAKAKAEPGKINYASSGAGSTGHLLVELLQRSAGIELMHVPYKGGAPALQDVLGGVVSVIVVPPNTAIAHIKAGKLKLLAVSMAQRNPAYPDVPTFEELGFAQMTVSSWVGLSAPKGTPAAIVQRINAAMETSLARPALRARLEGDGMTPMLMSPAQFGDLVRSDAQRWIQLTKSLNIKAH
jgi:tripartite-type tricarboxylate transporter receptor subunit TctC